MSASPSFTVLRLFSVALLCGSAVSAHAQDYADDELYACTTHSKGQPFLVEDYDYNTAATTVVSQCQQAHETDLEDCTRNLHCGDRYDPYALSPKLRLAYLMEGTWSTSMGSGSSFRVTRYGNQLYARVNDGYNYALEPLIVVTEDIIQFKGDQFSVAIRGGLIRLVYLSGSGRSGLAYASMNLANATPRLPARPARRPGQRSYPLPPVPRSPVYGPQPRYNPPYRSPSDHLRQNGPSPRLNQRRSRCPVGMIFDYRLRGCVKRYAPVQRPHRR